MNVPKKSSFLGIKSQISFTQAGDLYRLMDEGEKARTVANIVESMKPVLIEEIKLRATLNFYKADREFGERIAQGLNLRLPQEVK